MEQMIRDITKQLISKLPEDREFYTPEDLQVLDLPEFVTERVVIEMNQNLNESLAPPDTEWANMDSPAVQFAWKNFIEAIKAEVTMPASYAKPLFEAAVADTLDLALKPRTAIPDTLFGADTDLTIQQVKKRIRYITVGRQLAAALVRYMEKKEKEAISLDECQQIVTRVDEKLINGHNSLDWAKETEPLFLLAGPRVDTEFLRIYFDHKNLPGLAARFDRVEHPVNRTEFIEILSAPAIDDEEEAAGLKKAEGRTADDKKEDKQQKDQKGAAKAPGQVKKKGEKGDAYVPDDSILSSFQKRRGEIVPEEESEEDPEVPDAEPSEGSDESDARPLHERFVFDEDAAAEKDQESAAEEKEPETIYDEMNFSRQQSDEDEDDEGPMPSMPQFDPELLRKWKTIGGVSEDEDEPILEETDKPDEEDEPVASIELYNETDDEEDVPMWRAFLEREDLSKLREEEEEIPEPPVTGKQTVSDLEKWIGKNRKRVIRDIFSGSEDAYKKAVSELSSKKDWRSAAGYLDKEVFKKNNITLSDEAAVSFTDSLQDYYTQKKG
jgi:hypothetical protein